MGIELDSFVRIWSLFVFFSEVERIVDIYRGSRMIKGLVLVREDSFGIGVLEFSWEVCLLVRGVK